MYSSRLSIFSKVLIVVLGATVVVNAIVLQRQAFGLGFAALLVASTLIAPRMSLVIPRSNVVISLSDSVVYLSFLLYGAEAAVIMALAETFANCYYHKMSGTIKFGRH